MFDYVIICGCFTAKFQVGHAEFRDIAKDTLRAVWPSLRLGLDRVRDDLFHWRLDEMMMTFCKRDLSRHVPFRLDCGLWEIVIFVNKAAADAWQGSGMLAGACHQQRQRVIALTRRCAPTSPNGRGEERL